MNWLLIILIILLISRILVGYKRGMVKEVVSFISLIVLCMAAAFIGGALLSYLEKDTVSMVFAIILLLLLGIAHRVINSLLLPAKVLANLPVVKTVDKILGIVIGIAETILIIWTLYTLILTVEMGTVGEQIMVYVQENRLLTLLYQYNYLAHWVSGVLDKLTMLPL